MKLYLVTALWVIALAASVQAQSKTYIAKWNPVPEPVAYYSLYVCHQPIVPDPVHIAMCSDTLYRLDTSQTSIIAPIPNTDIKGRFHFRLTAVGLNGKPSGLIPEVIVPFTAKMNVHITHKHR